MREYSQERLRRYALDCIPCGNRKGYCTHCGAKLSEGSSRCPHCRREIAHTSPENKAFGYFTIQTAQQGRRIEIYYQARAVFKVRQPLQFEYVAEVFRIAEDERGKLSCKGLRQGIAMYGCLDYFSTSPEIVNRRLDCQQIQTITSYCSRRHTLAPQAWPKPFRALGLARASLIMADPHGETLVKSGSYLLDWLWSKGDVEAMNKYWPQIKIANRRGYRIPDVRLWCDTVKALQAIGKDIHSPKYICPANLKAMHDWAMRKRREQREQEEAKRRAAKAKQYEAAYAQRMASWIAVSFADGSLHAHVLQSVAEFKQEGDAMHHCVFDCEYYAKEDCVILGVTDGQGNRIATIEYRPSTHSILQCYGKYNSTPANKAEIEQFILRNIRKAA